MNRKALTLIVAVCTVALGLAGFSELRVQDSPERPRQTPSKNSEKPAKEAKNSPRSESEVQKTDARKTSGRAEKQGAEESGVKLKLAGAPGIEFSGRCSVDGEERELEGRTPETYSYEPEERLECGISSKGEGVLRVTSTGGEDTNSTQQVGPGTSSLELTYTGSAFSLSTSTRSGGSSGSGGSQTSSSQSSFSVIRQSGSD